MISEKTGVSKSTLYGWLATVPYTPNKEVVARIGKARAALAAFKARQKRDSILRAKTEAKRDVGYVTDRDLFMLGLGIYIGEGAKSGDLVRIINSDPKIIRLSIKWFERVCKIPTENFVIRLHIYPNNNLNDCISYWSKEINIPTNQFQKTQIDRRKNKKMFKRGKLPYGTAHITVKSNGDKNLGSFLGRKIRAWIDEVL